MRKTDYLFYNRIMRNALLIHDEIAHPLEGPFDSREEAEQASTALIHRLELNNQSPAPSAGTAPTCP